MEIRRECGKKRFYILLAMALLLSVLFIGQRAEAADYDIKQYHVDMEVSETNVYTIHETIQVYFYQSRHGIYRDIPLKNNVIRADGSTARVMASISDISCGSDDFTISRDGSNCRVKIGDKDKTITGDKTYTISYDYNMGNDVLKDADEFYYNVIGLGWEAYIENVTFSIRMPKSFDENLLGMTYGPAGSPQTEGLTFSVDGNRISGELDSDIMLSPREGVTVRLELPEGYFVKKSEVPWMAFIAIALGIITMIVSYLLWNIYGKDDPVVETVEFYAPGGLNSAEAAYVYSGSISDKAVVSLVVYLAQKGFIEIREGAEGKKKDFTLIKKKDYDGTNQSEEMFMSGLFKKKNAVTKKDLEDKFYTTVNQVGFHIASQYKLKIFYANSLNKTGFLVLLLALMFVATGYMPMYQYSFSVLKSVSYPLICGAIFLVVFCFLWSTSSSLAARIISFVAALVMFGAMGLALVGPAIWYAGKIYHIAFVLSFFDCAVVTFFMEYMSKRTPYGNEMLGKLRGLKKFLETAEKNRLEAMVAESPRYFYDILPYTYALGVSEKWMKKFESIAVEPPEWHHSYDNRPFNAVAFHTFMNSTMSSVNTAMTSSPSSSGGGVSGGGSGGGGGGSW